MALPGLAADECKAQEAEGLRSTEPALRACDRGKAAKLDQAGLLRVQRQRELPQPCTHFVPKAPGLGFLLKADHNVIRITQNNYGTRGLTPSPARSPEVESIMQVDIG
jgi:hypothetical protein